MKIRKSFAILLKSALMGAKRSPLGVWLRVNYDEPCGIIVQFFTQKV
jgi:hypothetical protein